ncbi:MAG: hypothetical protein NTU45_14940 [Planctomycetota bacterium]|nr:hypothetical protein [Planctomycetota bacterium]
MSSSATATASVSQCGMRFFVIESVTVCVYSCRSTASGSKRPRCFSRAPSLGISIAIVGPVQTAIVWMRGRPVMRTPKLR